MPLVLFVLTGLLCIGLAVPMILRRVPPNHLYGLRVRATFANEEVWYEANAASGWDLAWLGVVLVLLALGLPWLGLGKAVYALLWSAAAGAGALAVGILGWRRANRLLRERSR